MMKRSIILIINLVIALSILTLLTSQWPGGAAQSQEIILIPSQEINLIDNKHTWKPFGDTIISQNESNLEIVVVTAHKDKTQSRAFFPTQINSTMNTSLILTFDYASKSSKGNATFLAEIRGNTGEVIDNSSSKILWHNRLNNTNGQLSNEVFTIPSNILNRPVEFRLYAFTNGPGEHVLTVKKATIMIH
jgi:hypothetical protein